METMNDTKCILIVDDEADIREILQFNLENEGYLIDSAESAEVALKKISDKHQLILLDVMMGEMSGYKLADKLRKSGNKIPIIFLTAKDTENDMLTGFSIGGDDYISKPFSIKEVIARVKSVIKRAQPESVSSTINKNTIKVENLLIDLDSKMVSVDSKFVDLTKTEYNILVLLTQDLGKTYSRSDILDIAWDRDGIVLERTVDVHIARLRKKIGKYGDYIVNRTGYGYNFNINK